MAKQLFGWADQSDFDIARGGTRPAGASTLVDALNEIRSDFGYAPIVSTGSSIGQSADRSTILGQLNEILRILDDATNAPQTPVVTAFPGATRAASREIRGRFDVLPPAAEKLSSPSSPSASTGLVSSHGTLDQSAEAPAVTEQPASLPAIGDAQTADSADETPRDSGDASDRPENPETATLAAGASTGLVSSHGTLDPSAEARAVTEQPASLPAIGDAQSANSANETPRDSGDASDRPENPETATLAAGASTGLVSSHGTLDPSAEAPAVTEQPASLPAIGDAQSADSANETPRDSGDASDTPENPEIVTLAAPTNLDLPNETLHEGDDTPVVMEEPIDIAPEEPAQIIPVGPTNTTAFLTAPAAQLLSTSPSAKPMALTMAAPRPRRRRLAVAAGIALVAGIGLSFLIASPGDKVIPTAIAEKLTHSLDTVIVWSTSWRAAPSLSAKPAREREDATAVSAPSTTTAKSTTTANRLSTPDPETASVRATKADHPSDAVISNGPAPANTKTVELAARAGADKPALPSPAGLTAFEVTGPGPLATKLRPVTSESAVDRAPGSNVLGPAVPTVAPAPSPALPEPPRVIATQPAISAPAPESASTPPAAESPSTLAATPPPVSVAESQDTTAGRTASSASHAPETAQAGMAEQRNEARPAASVAAKSQRAADSAASAGMRDQGDAQMVKGDISTARLYYGVAAANGDADAALSLGNTYNPAFLAQLGVLGMRGDIAQASEWYHRAQILGSRDAERALQTLSH